MAVYVPSAKVAVEIVDDPTSLPVDLDAFPDFTIIPVTCADLSNPGALNRTLKRIARVAAAQQHATGGPRTANEPSSQERKQLLDLISTGLELTHGSAMERAMV